MNVNINLSSIIEKNPMVSKYNEKSKSKKLTKSISVRKSSSVFAVDKVKIPKKKMSPQKIAKRIAEGKHVTREEAQYLKETFPDIYREAMSANRLRETLEQLLKSAKSETAKAAAVAQAGAQASLLVSASIAKGTGDGMMDLLEGELYSDAIQAALHKYGSNKLNKEMEEFQKDNQKNLYNENQENLLSEEEILQS